MKKLTALFLSFAMVLSFAACGSSTSSGTSTSESSAPSASSETQEPSTTPETEESSKFSEAPSSQPESAEGTGNTLVVYFSATGNTEEAAHYIADLTGGDLFELEPVEPYTDEDLNYNNDDSRVSQEYADESLRDIELVADTVDNWDSYDTVFIGYPIWWGIAAWPVDTFVEANDFTGKTVIPSALPPAPAWVKAESFWASLLAPATGRKGCVSAPASVKQTCRNGWTA